ncbi:hypothetical protein TEA_017081 [Camellia sinensis var. sinensis]|uniref:Helicase MOV-10-like beta-barrel domain-containing protein n=1 Tax=Camellia sinensis var. sinensis TaxID=542762 RepID=A0A4S4DUZ4_CAMSN|nr:hypothetical protein TEA_017081 [Camellia sinensis var. sinensis]
MSLIGRERCGDDFSVIGDKGEIGFIDFEDDKSLCAYDPNEEGPVLISIPFPFIQGKPLSVFVGETSVHPIAIQNTRSEPVELWGGIIHRLEADDVLLKFSKNFHMNYKVGVLQNIRFS